MKKLGNLYTSRANQIDALTGWSNVGKMKYSVVVLGSFHRKKCWIYFFNIFTFLKKLFKGWKMM